MRNLTLYSTIILICGILTAYSKLLNLSLIISIFLIIILIAYYLIDKKYIVYLILLGSFFIFGFSSFDYSNYNPLDKIYGYEVEIIGKINEIEEFDDAKDFMKAIM